MSGRKKSDNSGNSNNKDKIEPIQNKKASNEGDTPIDNHKYMQYLNQNEKQKFNKLMKTSGLSEDELVADAISQFTKRRSLGKKERAKNHTILQEDFNEIILSIPPELSELREELIIYKSKEEALWRV